MRRHPSRPHATRHAAIALALVAVVAAPAVAPPAVALAAEPIPAPNDQVTPAVAFDGEVFLVVWWDQRRNDSDIYAARVSLAGKVLDPDGIPIATTDRLEWMPTVASDGDGFLVAWAVGDDPACVGDDPCPEPGDLGDIKARRVTSAGAVLDSTPLHLGPGAGLAQFPHATAGGGGYLVAWEERLAGTTDLDLRAAMVSPAGAITRAAWTAVDRPGNQHLHDIVGTPTRFAIGWMELSGDYDTYLQLLEADGDVVEAAIPVADTRHQEIGPFIAWDGSTFLATWRHDVGDGPTYGLARRIGADGTLDDPGSILVHETDGLCERIEAADVQGLPGRFVLPYTVNRGYCADQTGTGWYLASVIGGVVSGTKLVYPGGWTISAYAASSTSVLWVVDVMGADFTRDIYARRMTLDGDFLDPAWTLVSTVTGDPPPPSDEDVTPPTVGLPRTRVTVGARLGSGTNPVGVSWTSSDPSGVAASRLQVSRDGGAWTEVPTTTLTTATWSLAHGHQYRFRVQARDGAGNWSPWKVGTRFEVRRVQETSTAITYRGTWARRSLSGASGGYVKAATGSTARANYRFTGKQVAWVGTKGPTRGRARVYLNGDLVATIDLWAPTTTTRTVLFARSWTTSATRTITIAVRPLSTRARVDVDAFVVLR